MKGLFSNIGVAALAATTAFATLPASAAPLARIAPAMQTANADLIQVQAGPRRGESRWRGHRHHHRHWGHHHRNHHRHWRHRDNDDWVGPAIGGLITGAIIGGVLGNSSGGNAHVRWCYDHYRSYRASDNTYQPYNGPRRQCVSPY